MKWFFQDFHGIGDPLWRGLHQMDVKTVFLSVDLEENFSMDQLMWFLVEGKKHMVCKLKKSIYGLKQASR